MKRSIIFLIITLFSFFTINSCCNTTCPTEPITGEFDGTFPDPAFEAAIRNSLNMPEGDITVDDLEGLTYISISYGDDQITNISGIEFCKFLEWINLSGSNIKDYSPLNSLVFLKGISMYNSILDNIGTYTKQDRIIQLDIGGCNISDISFIESFQNLRQIDLSSNQIIDVAPLAKLAHLYNIHISNNNINDLSPLSEMKQLVRLYASHNNITTIPDLSGCENLNTLSLTK